MIRSRTVRRAAQVSVGRRLRRHRALFTVLAGLALVVAGLLAWPASPAEAATVVVTNANTTTNTGDGVSLTEAIRSINAGADFNSDVVAVGTYGTDDTIRFAIPAAGVQTITGVPIMTRPVLIDGFAQPGSSANTLATGDNAVRLIRVSGPGSEDPSTLTIDADNVTLRGLDIACPTSIADAGITVRTGRAGATLIGNVLEGYRCIVVSSAPNAIIGGASPAARNSIHVFGPAPSGPNNPIGIAVQGAGSAGAVIRGNIIRADSQLLHLGAIAAYGILVQDAPNVTIGGPAAGAGNVTSGIRVAGVTATGATIQGNLIGLNEAGVASSNYFGVYSTAPNALIGGTVVGAGNVVSGNSGEGIIVSGAGTVVQGNLIGLNPSGTSALGNGAYLPTGGASSTTAAALRATGPDVTIGGTEPGAGNVVSGNAADGIWASGGVLIQGNHIGTNAPGTAAIGNVGYGIVAGTGVTIGGTAQGAENVISGNTTSVNSGGILIGGTGVVVQGNLIGTDVGGTLPIPNRQGILIQDASNTTIGGLLDRAGDIIAFNTQGGVSVTTSVGTATGNTIRGNRIFGNHRIGIDLGPQGATSNDAGDLDVGPNSLQNFPVLATASVGFAMTQVVGTLNSTPNTAFTIDFYSGPGCDAAGTSTGQSYLGSISTTTNSSGDASFTATGLLVSFPDTVVTATATDPIGNTSEDGFCQEVKRTGVTVSPTLVVVAEGGSGQTFTVSLMTAPTSPVTVLLSYDPGVVTASLPGVVFPANAIGSQVFTITAVDNSTVNGTRSIPISFDVSSSDPQYHLTGITPVTATVVDNDAVQAIVISPAGGLVTTEIGGTATFTVRLTVVPTAPVVIPLSSSNVTEGTVSPATLTFRADTSALAAQTVTVTGVNDALADGNVAYTILLGAVQSSDPSFAGVNPPDVSATNNAVNGVVSCSPRPSVHLTTEKTSDGRLRVVVGATTTLPGPPNQLVQIQFQAGANANVQIPGLPTRTGAFNYDLPAGTQTFEFFVGRVGPGATHLPFRVIDGCGPSRPWTTFVGGGPTAF